LAWSTGPAPTILRYIYCNIILIAGPQSRAEWRTDFVWWVCSKQFVFIVVAGGLFFRLWLPKYVGSTCVWHQQSCSGFVCLLKRLETIQIPLRITTSN